MTAYRRLDRVRSLDELARMIATFRGYRRAAGLDPFDESAPFAARIAEIETEIDRRLGVAG